jgi:hypothetical protein
MDMLKGQDEISHKNLNRPLVSRIETSSIETFLGEEDHPLFIAVLTRDHGLLDCIRQLEELAAAFHDDGLMVCYTLEELFPYFSNRFNVGGTPTFLMIISGIVFGTILGKNPTPVLQEFIRENLCIFETKRSSGRGKDLMKSGKPAHQKRAVR